MELNATSEWQQHVHFKKISSTTQQNFLQIKTNRILVLRQAKHFKFSLSVTDYFYSHRVYLCFEALYLYNIHKY